MKDFNFFEPFLGEKKAFKYKYAVMGVIIGTLMTFVIISYGWNFYKLYTLKENIKTMEEYLNKKEIVEKSKAVESLKKQIEVGKKQYAELDVLAAEMKKKDIVSTTLLDKIISVVPQNLGFKAVQIQPAGIQFQGVSTDRIAIAEFEHNIKALTGLKEVFVSNITKSTGKEEYAFTLQCIKEEESKNENKQ